LSGVRSGLTRVRHFYTDDAHILRTFVHQLRAKVGAISAAAAAMIVTDPGVGYRIVEPTPPENGEG